MRWPGCGAFAVVVASGCLGATDPADLTPPSSVPPLAFEVPPAEEGRVVPVPALPSGTRPVVSVGDEVITFAELSAVVKTRLEQFGLDPGQAPTHREVIALARSSLKSMIVRSLVVQEARANLGPSETLEGWTARFERDWDDRERPALLHREGVATEAELRSKLARSLATPESLRDDFVVRSLASELIARDRSGRDFDAYLDVLKGRRPIVARMTPAELIAEGRRAAEDRPSPSLR